MGIFSGRLNRPDVTREDILNKGVQLSLHFGANHMQPIHERLLKRYPHLAEEKLNEINALSYRIQSESCEYFYQVLGPRANVGNKISQKDLISGWRSFIIAKYPWLDKRSLNALRGNGFYMCWHDGLWQDGVMSTRERLLKVFQKRIH